MAKISSEFVQFFRELSNDNTKEWFHANKKRYEHQIKQPFYDLLEELIPALQQFEPEISTEAKNAVFRINRDIRFSKDKSPYNTVMKAGFAPGGKKSELPGYYLGISAEYLHVGGGLYNLKPAQLTRVRTAIAKNIDMFIELYSAPDFRALFGEIQGERHKRLSKDLQIIQERMPYIANKQFYYMARYPVEGHLDTNINDFILKHYQTIQPLNSFFKKAMI